MCTETNVEESESEDLKYEGEAWDKFNNPQYGDQNLLMYPEAFFKDLHKIIDDNALAIYDEYWNHGLPMWDVCDKLMIKCLRAHKEYVEKCEGFWQEFEEEFHDLCEIIRSDKTPDHFLRIALLHDYLNYVKWFENVTKKPCIY